MIAKPLREQKLIAILRGITPHEAVAIAGALQQSGVECLETPLNSPEPLTSIAAMRAAFPDTLLVGAGTVLCAEDVEKAADAGAQFIVSPNTDRDVIAAAKRRGLASAPGFYSASEAFTAAHAGASALKLFPADSAGPAYLKALKAVLPQDLPVFAVGGVTPSTVADWIAAGAAGFGIGGALYKPGDPPASVAEKAAAFVEALNNVSSVARRGSGARHRRQP